MMKIVIIGAVAAGLKSAAKARRVNPQAEITVVDKGALISYGACGLPYYVSAEVDDIEELMKTPAGVLRNPEYFKSVKDITVLSQTLATGIDRNGKTVQIKNLVNGDESSLPYDKLVLATGASPLKPALPGMELSNIFTLWHPDDAKAIRKGMEQGKFKNVVIIGAGLVGIEMMEALKIWTNNVTVIEMKSSVFPAFLDPEIAALVDKYIIEEDINLLTNERVVKFEGDGAVSAVVTDKRTITADLVIMSLGVRPNVELAAAAGLEIGVTGAIAVNSMLQTSDPDIFAGGDCVENVNIISNRKVFAPMGSTANKHGRIIGENLFGGNARFKGVLNTAIVKVMDMTVGKTGLTERDAKELGLDYVTVISAGHDKPHYMEDATIIAIKLIADPKTRKVLGMQSVGEGDVAKRVDVVASILTLGGTIDDLFDIDLAYAPPYSSPIDNIAVAANALMNKIDGNLKGISSFQARELLENSKTVFVDVRSAAEFKQARIAGYDSIVNIPLGDLRSRLGELNKDDEIVTFCKISLRGYEAEGILEGEDFKNVRVMEGGLFTWPFESEP
jgi:NADPH-dependent 2,4-dienoyl-CoA reductase/sulfur reductase-like enzyme/rhodanese-related sulfurtransferase